MWPWRRCVTMSGLWDVRSSHCFSAFSLWLAHVDKDVSSQLLPQCHAHLPPCSCWWRSYTHLWHISPKINAFFIYALVIVSYHNNKKIQKETLWGWGDGLELKRTYNLLLLQVTSVQFLAPKSHVIQPPETSAAGDPTPFLDICIHICIDPHLDTYI